MTFTRSVKKALSKYATFKGRATRSEYWWFVVFCVLVVFALIVIGNVLANSSSGVIAMIGLLLMVVPGVALIVPSIAVATRRLHDTGRSGWWQLLYVLLPLGWLILLFFFASRGTDGPNRYGRAPAVTWPQGALLF